MAATMPKVTETWTGKIREITLGAMPAEGGSRRSTVTVGGQNTLPFLHFEGDVPHRPAVAIEILDRAPEDWSPLLLEAWGSAAEDPAAWAAAAEEAGAELLVLSLDSAHTERGNSTAADARARVRAVLQATGLPLIVLGPGQVDQDNEVLVAAAEEAAGERVALGYCEDKNYRTIVAAALANQQLVIARSPIDVNLAKQLNILITDMRLGLERVIMDPTTGALGYGIEYTYSVIERLRLAALTGDSVLQQPIIVTAGPEAWRTKEARTGEGVPAAWGDWASRAVMWEASTATSLLEAGADMVVLRHPHALPLVKRAIDGLMTSE